MADNPFIKARDAVDALFIQEAGAGGGAAGARDEKARIDAINRGDIMTAVVQNFKVDGDVLANARHIVAEANITANGLLGGPEEARDARAMSDAYARGDIKSGIENALKTDKDFLVNAKNFVTGLPSTIEHNAVHTFTTPEGAENLAKAVAPGAVFAGGIAGEVVEHMLQRPDVSPSAKPIAPASPAPKR